MNVREWNAFEKALAALLGEENLKKIQQVAVGIAGAGGLGSNCAMHLVRSGFVKLVIADFDTIEYSNLNRQFYSYHQVGQSKVEALKSNLLHINPNLQVEIWRQRVEADSVPKIFEKCHIVVEAFDQAKYKKMLVEQYLDKGKFIVAASGIAGWGDADNIKTHKVKENVYVVGDLVSEAGKGLPPCAPRVSIAAAKQANLVFQHVLANS